MYFYAYRLDKLLLCQSNFLFSNIEFIGDRAEDDPRVISVDGETDTILGKLLYSVCLKDGRLGGSTGRGTHLRHVTTMSHTYIMD